MKNHTRIQSYIHTTIQPYKQASIQPYLFFLLMFLFTACNKDENPVANHNSYSSEILNDLVTAIEDDGYGGEVHSIVIAIDDTIIFEEYFNGYTRENAHTMYSVTKSFTSAVMGICIDKGWIDSTGMKVLDIFPEYSGSIANPDPRKNEITIEHLLTMTAGFTWDEWSTSYASPDNPIAGMSRSSDWVKYVLDLPLSYTPGTHATYNSGVSHVISGIITKETGNSARDIAAENIFTRLGFQNWSWQSTGNISIGGWGLQLRPLDMIKFGQLYLHNGRWGNEQIISEEWVQRSLNPYNQINYYCDYGYQWWRYNARSPQLYNAGIYFCAGRGEQFIWVIPQYNAVAVCTAWNDGSNELEPVLWEYILPALEN